MLEVLAILSLAGALILLFALSYIDLRDGLLPNELVMGLAATGLVFHLCLLFYYLSMADMVMGAVVGGGILYAIRQCANFIYKEDALGLGDVKLMAAGGIWLGLEGILIAMTIGAFAGFIHGLSVALISMRKAGIKASLSRFSIPAGPGFAAGLLATAIYLFRDLPFVFMMP